MALGFLIRHEVPYVIPIHFDVDEHAIALDTFIETAHQMRAVFQSINVTLLGNGLEVEFVLLPAEEGGFLGKIGVTILACTGAAWAFLNSDVGGAFIEGLTSHPPSYWSRNIGVSLRNELSKGDTSDMLGSSGVETKQVGKIQCKAAAVVVSEVTKSFLITETERLSSIGIRPDNFRDTFEARNRFYESCIDNPKVHGVGFDEVPDFPINRADFARFQVALPPNDDTKEVPWHVEIARLRVSSPNWDRNDKGRLWKARDSKGRDRYFSIEDEHFWELAKFQKLDTHGIDRIKVQWAFHGDGNQKREAFVIRLLEYNDEKISEPLTDDEVKFAIGAHLGSDPRQGDLF